MSPRLSTEPIVVEALLRGSRLGCLLASIGVGTVTMWKSAASRSFAEAEKRRVACFEIGGLDLACAIVAARQLGDAALVDVIADHRHARSRESGRCRQSDIAKADHRDFALVAHPVDLWLKGCFIVTRAGL